MIRMYIQITSQQYEELASLATRMGLSHAALVRQAIDLLLRQQRGLLTTDSRTRALAAIGAVQSSEMEPDDVAEHHDRYLAQLG